MLIFITELKFFSVAFYLLKNKTNVPSVYSYCVIPWLSTEKWAAFFLKKTILWKAKDIN